MEKPFPVPRIHELTFKQELNRIEYLKVIKKVNCSQWGAPTFIITKKDSTVRFISDFRELNKHILRQPYPITQIQDLLLETKIMKRILDAKYSKANIKSIAESSTHLDPQERNGQYTLLKKYECLFDGNLGTCHGKPYDIKLKPDAEPYNGNLFLLHAYMNSRSNKNSIDSSILR